MSILELAPDCFFAPHTEGLRPIAFYGFLHFFKGTVRIPIHNRVMVYGLWFMFYWYCLLNAD